MQSTWRESGSGKVTVSQPGPGMARLFGLPFLAVGGYLLYQLVGGLLQPAEMTVAGWVILPLMTAAFLVPGWLITVFRKRTELDVGTREVLEIFDFLVYTHRRRTEVLPGAQVMLRYERGSERSTRGPAVTHTRTSFWVHLYVVVGSRMVLVALFEESEKATALALAQKVGSLLAIEVQDRCVEGGEITSGGVVVDRLDPDEADPPEADQD
ncbi:MAG TPA: hypothetical protein VJU18_13555 [Vicinamibacteria bacterium]|nr:hypothetical protein [Vicinamibacteria bacterium]